MYKAIDKKKGRKKESLSQFPEESTWVNCIGPLTTKSNWCDFVKRKKKKKRALKKKVNI